jgi:hypothetical protein
MAAQHSTVTAPEGARRLLVVLLGLVLPFALLPVGAGAATGDPVLLNEALVSHTGTDTTEYFELFGTAGTPLTGLSLIVVEGDGAAAGTLDFRLDLPSGARLGGNRFYLAGGAAGLNQNYGVAPDAPFPGPKTSDWIENGSETLALAETATLGDVGSALTGSEAVLDAVGLSDGGAADRWFFGAPVIGPDDIFLPAGVRRATDGVDTDGPGDWLLADDILGEDNTPTPSTPYDAPPTADCGPSVSTTEGTATRATVSAVDPDGMIVTFTASPDPVDSAIGLGTVVPATEPGETASAEVDVGAAAAPGSYAVTVEATNDGAAPQSASCVLAVQVVAAPEPTPEPPPAPPSPVSLDGLTALVSLHVDAGDVAASRAHLLTDRLERVQRFLDAGQTAAAVAQLQAFANQVAGLSPRWVEAGAAAEMIAAAEELQATLGT